VPARVAEVEDQSQARLGRRPPGERSKRGLEPGLVEDVRMQVEDRIRNCATVSTRVSSARAISVSGRARRSLEHVTDGKEVLERVVVQ
jgi:hypothetical protein